LLRMDLPPGAEGRRRRDGCLSQFAGRHGCRSCP
jgi:hypothetical protein